MPELGHVGDAALEQIAQAIPRCEQVRRVLDLDVGRQHDDRDLREVPADRLRRVKALGRMTRRHPDIDEGQVRHERSHEREELSRIARLADDVVPGALHQGDEALAEQDVVVGDHHAHELCADLGH
jgi:hypothetical protein